MGILDELKAEAERLKGIKAPRAEGNGYNMPAGRKRLAKRVKDAAARQKLKEVRHDRP